MLLIFVSLRNFIPSLKQKQMKVKKLITVLAIIAVAALPACKKDKPATVTSATSTPVVIPMQTTVQTTVPLAGASGFAVIAGSSVTSTGSTSITGDLGLSPGTSVTGFPPGILIGIQHISDSIADQAKLDLTAAYNDAAGRTCTDKVLLQGNMGGLTLTPGLYKSSSSLSISSGDLTFDAKGNANAVFVIQMASTLTVSAARKVILTGGALASNIFWQVGSSATFESASEFKGTIMAMQAITFKTGASLDGKALARTAGVSMEANTIVNQ
jgi:hypothetical protein